MTTIEVQGLHEFNEQKKQLPIQYESAGTKQLFILLKTILQVLDRGGIAVLDEIDINLHPEIVLALFDLFIQPETNPKKRATSLEHPQPFDFEQVGQISDRAGRKE